MKRKDKKVGLSHMTSRFISQIKKELGKIMIPNVLCEGNKQHLMMN